MLAVNEEAAMETEYDKGDPGELEEISEAECWRLIADPPVGRIAVVVGHYPLVFPVNFVVVGRTIAFRTGPGTKLWAIHRCNVTFEADSIDPVHQRGWSVMARGVAQEVIGDRHPELAGPIDGPGRGPWAPGPREHLVRIVVDSISGRRIRPADLAPATDPRGYV
jgi:hypothetical protein